MIKTDWDLGPLFESDSDPKIEEQRKQVDTAINAFIKKWKERNDYLEQPQILKEALDDYNELMETYGTSGNEEYYFWLRLMQDQNNPEIKAKLAKAQQISQDHQNGIRFFKLSISKIPEQKHQLFLTSQLLVDYHHFLNRLLIEGKYVLTENEEKILMMKHTGSYERWVELVSGKTAKEEREIDFGNGIRENKSFSELISLTAHADKNIRDQAAAGFNDIMYQHTEVAEAELNAVLDYRKVEDELRGLERPDHARHVDDDIDTDVVDTLIATVSEHFSVSQEYYRFKAQLLGVEKLEYHERNVEIGTIDQTYPWEQGVQLVQKVFSQLDAEFGSIFEKFISNGHMDVFPKKGKRGGAFCSYWLKSQPTYILLNYTEKLTDVLTLAHECGHGINNELIKQKQHALNFGTPTSTAEVASTFTEDFVLRELVKNVDDEARLNIAMTKLDSDIAVIFRQVACYLFEKDLHTLFREKGYLSHQEIGSLFQQHMSAYMGPGVEQSPGSENWWIYWSHIRTFFYVYSYSSGLLISKSMQSSVQENPAFIENVKEFLSTGLAASPKEIFAKLGIDITDQTFWMKGIKEVEQRLAETQELAKKLGKIK